MSRTPPPSRGQTDESSTESAVPTLRVMRLQSPELHQPTAGSLESRSLLNTAHVAASRCLRMKPLPPISSELEQFPPRPGSSYRTEYPRLP
jgi:hypothetical protein